MSSRLEPEWFGIDYSSLIGGETVGYLFVDGRFTPISLNDFYRDRDFAEQQGRRNAERIANLDEALQRESVASKEAAKRVDTYTSSLAYTRMTRAAEHNNCSQVQADTLNLLLKFHGQLHLDTKLLGALTITTNGE